MRRRGEGYRSLASSPLRLNRCSNGIKPCLTANSCQEDHTYMRIAVTPPKLISIWRAEFQNYTLAIFQRDLLAGLTVGAVALPLALAFGVASGSTPAAGLVTAIIAGLIIAGFGG